jgi:outer membrane receptor protein involved in Fe transport
LTSYAQFKQHQAADGDGMYYVGFDVPQDDGSLKSFNQELRLASDTTQALRWIVGANFEKSKTYEEQTLRYFGNSNYSPGNLYINSSSDRLNQDIRNYAFFGDLEYRLGRLTLKGSARYTNSRNNAVNLPFAKDGTSNLDKLFNILGGLSGFSFTPIGPGQSVMLNSTPASLPSGVTLNFPTQSGNLGLGVPGYALDASLKEHNVSWRVGLDYQATSDVLLYANVSRGYKAGSFPVLAPSQIVSALPVNQESVTAYEAGIKASFMDRKVQFNAAGFYNDYRNKQVKGKLYDFVFGTLDALVNVPKSRIWGAEAQLTVRPIEGLTIDGSATYLNSKVTKYYGYDIYGGISNSNFVPGSPGNQEDLSGNPLPYTPKWSGAINVDYKRHLASGGAPFIGVTVNARSGQDAAIGGGSTTLPTGPRYRIADGVGPFPYTIASYATVDARLGYEAADGNWRVMLWGKNIFDKYYWNAVVPSSDSDGRLAGMPATYGVTFGFKFN